MRPYTLKSFFPTTARENLTRIEVYGVFTKVFVVKVNVVPIAPIAPTYCSKQVISNLPITNICDMSESGWLARVCITNFYMECSHWKNLVE